MRVTFLDADGGELFAEDRRATALVWFGGDAPVEAAVDARARRRPTRPHETGEVLLGFAGRQPRPACSSTASSSSTTPRSSRAPTSAPRSSTRRRCTARVAVTAGTPLALRAEFTIQAGGALAGALSATFGIAPDDSDPDGLIARAAAAAAAADVAIVVVGTNSKVESEGYDRETSTCPAARTTSSAPSSRRTARTIVVVNAGAPVALPWADEVAAVLQGYFGGQQFGAALADVLTGAVEPGGRLPTTWPAALADVPVTDVTPDDGVLALHRGHPHRLPRMAEGGCRAGVPVRPRPRLHDVVVGRRAARRRRRRGDPRQHRRPRRQAGRAGLRRARRLRGRAPRALARRLRRRPRRSPARP